jgi:hypothetical protein
MELRTHGLALTLDFSPPNEDDWLACHVTVEVPGFSGKYPCWVWRSDLQSFHQQLLQMIERVGQPSAANLTSTDPGIDLRFSMLERCYAGQDSIKMIAEGRGQKPNVVYMTLKRLRRALFDCINRTLVAEGTI